MSARRGEPARALPARTTSSMKSISCSLLLAAPQDARCGPRSGARSPRPTGRPRRPAAARRPHRRPPQGVDRRQERDGGIDVAHRATSPTGGAVDPGQQRIAAVAVDADDTRHVADVAALHQAQRADLGAEPVARIVAPRGILLEREAPARRERPDRSGCCGRRRQQLMHLDGRAQQRLGDVVRLSRAGSAARPRNTCSSMSLPGRADDVRRRPRRSLRRPRTGCASRRRETRDRREPPRDRR